MYGYCDIEANKSHSKTRFSRTDELAFSSTMIASCVFWLLSHWKPYFNLNLFTGTFTLALVNDWLLLLSLHRSTQRLHQSMQVIWANAHEMRRSLKQFLFACCLGLFSAISSQFTLKVCAAAENCRNNNKIAKIAYFEGSRSFKVINVDTP